MFDFPDFSFGHEHLGGRTYNRVVAASSAFNKGLHAVGVQQTFGELHLPRMKISDSQDHQRKQTADGQSEGSWRDPPRDGPPWEDGRSQREAAANDWT